MKLSWFPVDKACTGISKENPMSEFRRFDSAAGSGWRGHRSGTGHWGLRRQGSAQAWIVVKVSQGEILTVLLKDASKKHKSFIQFKTMKGLTYRWRYCSLNVHFIRHSFTECLYGKHLHKSHTPKRLPIISQNSVKSMGPEWWDLHPSGFFLLRALCWA